MENSKIEIEINESPEIRQFKEDVSNFQKEMQFLKDQIIDLKERQKDYCLKQAEFEDFKADIITKQSTGPQKLSTRIKNFFLNAVVNFSGHGISNIFLAKQSPATIMWTIFIVFFFANCCIYIVNSLAAFFTYEVVSNIRINYADERIFPAVTICGWESNYPINEGIFHCQFNNKDCDFYGIRLEENIVIGFGQSTLHYCVTFNGVKKNRRNKADLLTSRAFERFDAGLSISFLVPKEVNLSDIENHFEKYIFIYLNH